MESLPPKLQAAVEKAVKDNPDAMVSVIDEKDIIRYASISALPLFGYAPSELMGRPFTDFVSIFEIQHLRLVIQDAILTSHSVSTSRHVKVKLGGRKCMQGPARGFVDPETGQGFALAVGRPCDK